MVQAIFINTLDAHIRFNFNKSMASPSRVPLSPESLVKPCTASLLIVPSSETEPIFLVVLLEAAAIDFLSSVAALESKKDVKTRSTNQEEIIFIAKCVPLLDPLHEKNFFTFHTHFLITSRTFNPSSFIVATMACFFGTEVDSLIDSIFVQVLQRNYITLHIVKVEAELSDNER